MRLFLLFSVLLFLPIRIWAEDIVGTWEHTTVSRNVSSEIEERQRTLRTFNSDGTLIETIEYDECALSAMKDSYVLHFRATLKGYWNFREGFLYLRYQPRTLRVSYEGATFPERDPAVQKLLAKELEETLRQNIRWQLTAMQSGLRHYYTQTPKRLLRQVNVEGNSLFVHTREGEQVFQRLEQR